MSADGDHRTLNGGRLRAGMRPTIGIRLLAVTIDLEHDRRLVLGPDIAAVDHERAVVSDRDEYARACDLGGIIVDGTLIERSPRRLDLDALSTQGFVAVGERGKSSVIGRFPQAAA